MKYKAENIMCYCLHKRAHSLLVLGKTVDDTYLMCLNVSIYCLNFRSQWLWNMCYKIFIYIVACIKHIYEDIKISLQACTYVLQPE